MQIWQLCFYFVADSDLCFFYVVVLSEMEWFGDFKDAFSEPFVIRVGFEFFFACESVVGGVALAEFGKIYFVAEYGVAVR